MRERKKENKMYYVHVLTPHEECKHYYYKHVLIKNNKFLKSTVKYLIPDYQLLLKRQKIPNVGEDCNREILIYC